MPWSLLLALIFAFFAVVFRSASVRTTRKDEQVTLTISSGVLVVVASLLVICCCLTIVSTRNVGIVTSFGKPTGTLSNGLHLKAPWTKVVELDGTIQTNSKTGGFDGGGCSGGTPIRLANNSTACADNTVRWRINPTAGDALYRDYQSNNNIRDSLVTRELAAALNEVFADYNPLSADAAGGPNLTDLSAKATVKLRERTKGQILVESIIISIVHFDAQTQSKVNAYQAQVADTRIAQARQETALAEAEANRRLADSVARDPNVLVSRCLDMINAGKQVPVGFQCWPNGVLPLTIPAR